VAHLSATIPSVGAHLSAPSSHLEAVPWADTHVASSHHRACGDKDSCPNRDVLAPLVRSLRHRCLCRAPSSRRSKLRGVLPVDSRTHRRFAARRRVLTPSPSDASSALMAVRRHHWCYRNSQSKPDAVWAGDVKTMSPRVSSFFSGYRSSSTTALLCACANSVPLAKPTTSRERPSSQPHRRLLYFSSLFEVTNGACMPTASRRHRSTRLVEPHIAPPAEPRQSPSQHRVNATTLSYAHHLPSCPPSSRCQLPPSSLQSSHCLHEAHEHSVYLADLTTTTGDHSSSLAPPTSVFNPPLSWRTLLGNPSFLHDLKTGPPPRRPLPPTWLERPGSHRCHLECHGRQQLPCSELGYQPRSGWPVGWARSKPPTNCGLLEQCHFSFTLDISKSIQLESKASKICSNSNRFDKIIISIP
jgi:hypothetical protein